jgi:hypothetical protein
MVTGFDPRVAPREDLLHEAPAGKRAALNPPKRGSIPRRAARPAAHAAPGPGKAGRDKQRMQAFCTSYGDNIPGESTNVCSLVK